MDYRVGNFVYDRGEPVDLRPSQLVYLLQGLHLDYIKPIPLTRTWLERLGFEFYKPLGHYRIVINDIWVQVNVNEIIKGDPAFVFTFTNLNYDEVQHMPKKVLKYVHKLQNLFYEIMDVELPYKERHDTNG